MADALVSALLEQLASVMYQEMQQEVRQVVGVRKEVEKLTSTLQAIRAALVDAEKRQVTEEVVKDWLEKLRDISYDMNDVLDEWSTAILKLQIEGDENAPIHTKKVCSYFPSPCFCFSQVSFRHDIAVKIKELNERLDAIAFEKERYSFKSITSTEEHEQPKSTSLIDVLEVFGRDQDKKTIISKLLCESSQEERGLHIISIVGMGGMGKTTLAQLAYNNDDVKAYFHNRIWVCVSDPFDKIRTAKAILKALDPGSDPSSLDWENLPQHIHESSAGKKFLLVLDDVWTEDFKEWEPLDHSLRSGAQGSRILITTRNERVAKMMGTTYVHPLEGLSKEVCQSLFSQIALFKRSREDCQQLEEIGRKIADKCKGLPLAVKTLGSLMRFKKTKSEWQNVLDSEIWELEEAEKDLFPPLLLSYYDLPSSLKRCFSYCAIFPKDFVIETDKLIQLWMAQGYLNSRHNIEMETIGREYFENLVMRSFFQDFEKDEEIGNITWCKMHDIVHDFAQFLTKNECFATEVDGGRELSIDSSYRKGHRHLTVEFAAKGPLPVSIYNRESLHTLFVMSKATTNINIVPPDLFHQLKCLRALDLSEGSIRKLPREIGNLMHLRYLNLSGNLFEELPETVCDLCNLQTLDLVGCTNLMELPKGMGKLIYLRHLIISWCGGLRSLPKGIGRLSALRTLSKFIVSGGGEREACKLEDLKKLNHLQGRLEIRQLGYVADASEAERAELKRKKHLVGLTLDFSCRGVADVAEEKMYDVIEALQPHSNLERVDIMYYGGLLFPSWMTMFPNQLRTIELNCCCSIVCLPPLGKLPFLETLGIWGNDCLVKVGVEFLGLGVDDNDGTVSKDEASVKNAFPTLKRLEFGHMEEWEEWDMMITGSRKEEENEITIMPCLRSLTIRNCPKLKALPQHLQSMPLKVVCIRGCPILKERCQKEIGDDWAKISHIPDIRS